MQRREFLSASLSASLGVPLLLAPGESIMASTSQTPASSSSTAPQFYLWRQYTLRNGPQQKLMADFLRDAALPALNRLGMQPVGVFEAMIGAPSPTIYVLTPHASLEALLSIEAKLEADQAFLSAADPYIKATAVEPAYLRMESWLLRAFPNVPGIEVPKATATKGARMFELRIYESPSELAHRSKTEMFTSMGEVDIFRRTGLTPVFFSKMLVGPRMPNLVYMLTHENLAAREEHWKTFASDPEWKKVASTPGYSDALIVSNITTIFLRPAAYSQI
jgi:hypothetical protein